LFRLQKRLSGGSIVILDGLGLKESWQVSNMSQKVLFDSETSKRITVYKARGVVEFVGPKLNKAESADSMVQVRQHIQ
jgi:hypothetical protein